MHHCVQGSCSKLLIQNTARCVICISMLLNQNSSFSPWEEEIFFVVDSVMVPWALLRGQIRIKILSTGFLNFTVF